MFLNYVAFFMSHFFKLSFFFVGLETKMFLFLLYDSHSIYQPDAFDDQMLLRMTVFAWWSAINFKILANNTRDNNFFVHIGHKTLLC